MFPPVLISFLSPFFPSPPPLFSKTQKKEKKEKKEKEKDSDKRDDKKEKRKKKEEEEKGRYVHLDASDLTCLKKEGEGKEEGKKRGTKTKVTSN